MVEKILIRMQTQESITKLQLRSVRDDSIDILPQYSDIDISQIKGELTQRSNKIKDLILDSNMKQKEEGSEMAKKSKVSFGRFFEAMDSLKR